MFQDNGSAAFDALLSIASSGLSSQQRVALMKALDQAEANPVASESHGEGEAGDGIESSADQVKTSNEEEDAKEARSDAGEDTQAQ